MFYCVVVYMYFTRGFMVEFLYKKESMGIVSLGTAVSKFDVSNAYYGMSAGSRNVGAIFRQFMR